MDLFDFKRLVLGLIYIKAFSNDTAGISQSGIALQKYVSDPTEYNGVEIGKKINATLESLAFLNPSLRKVLDQDFARSSVAGGVLSGVLAVLDAETRQGQSLGQLNDYCLEQFAKDGGKATSESYTPGCIGDLLVELASPITGQVYDPCCGSGGLFVKARQYSAKRQGEIQIYGQESNLSAWQQCKMNLAVHRIVDANVGPDSADTFTRDIHSQCLADFILADPPFNLERWCQDGENLDDPSRWPFGPPPANNSNFAWIQHIERHLAPRRGTAAFTMANGALSSNASGESEIRQGLIQADLVSAIIALPKDIFFGTRISASIWVLTRDKHDRRGETLFIDAQGLGTRAARAETIIDASEIRRIASLYHAWHSWLRTSQHGEYADLPGFCRSVETQEIAAKDFQLLPARYVGMEASAKKESVHSAVKLDRLAARLKDELAESARLDVLIRDRLDRIGYEI